MEQTPEVGKVNNPEIFLGLFSKSPLPDGRLWLAKANLKTLISWIILDLSYWPWHIWLRRIGKNFDLIWCPYNFVILDQKSGQPG